ncbi:MAG: fibronectin type III domain-containing protein [Deltaproteobacteria bacterium]|nr:fibronectin type III domain-containing protein [Deltaproteobacteria bacterium]
MGKKIFALGICLLFFIAIVSYVHAGSESLTLAWDPPEGETPVTGYYVYQGTDGSTYSLIETISDNTVAQQVVTGLDENADYYFKVTAWNDAGEGPAALLGPVQPEDTTPPTAPADVSVE